MCLYVVESSKEISILQTMKCFYFNSKEKNDEPKTTKCPSGHSTSSFFSLDRDPRRSEFNSQDVSEFSTTSSVKSFAVMSQRHSNLREFTCAELKAATKNFSLSLMLGEGGFGGVYRGVIRSAQDPHKKIDIAVKQLSKRGLQASGHKEWVTEVNVLGIVEHQNLVKLLGYCAEDDERGIQRLLIYEYMPNRSVQDHLSSRFQIALPWVTRVKIAQDAARGLAYLHEEMEFQIIFRDFKSSNILLDEHWNAKLSDFGLARLGPSDGVSHVSTAVVGTVGYAAPEYIQTGHLTSKSDVWSYGIFIYELITGRRPVDRNRPKNEQKLLEWVRAHMSADSKKFQLIMDPRLEGKYSLKAAQKLAAVANRCLVRQPRSRPKMSEVLEMINRIVETTTDMGSPQQLPSESVEYSKNEFLTGSKREILRRKFVDPLIGENGCLNLQIWRPKIVKTC
ncbi:hypothetical protein ACLB2K_076414 [Fragaria x ananassa]